MNSSISGSRLLWILLLTTPSWRLCGQSINGSASDSLATVRAFVKNANRIEQKLILGDFAIQREVVYKSQIQLQEERNGQLTHELATSKATVSSQAGALTELKQQLGEQQLQTKRARLEVWAMRIAAALYLGAKLKGLAP